MSCLEIGVSAMAGWIRSISMLKCEWLCLVLLCRDLLILTGVLGENHDDDDAGGQHQTTVNIGQLVQAGFWWRSWSLFTLFSLTIPFSLIFQHFFIPLHEKEEKYKHIKWLTW